MNSFIRLLYSLLIAGAVVAFVGVGITSIYQAPAFPEPTFKPFNPDASQEEMDKVQEDNDRIWREHEVVQDKYNRNLTLLLLPAVVVISAMGLYALKKEPEVIREGVALGGIALSIYAIITASIANETGLRFIAVSLLLVCSLLLARKRFSEPLKTSPKPKKR